jgi:hypothetical protein
VLSDSYHGQDVQRSAGLFCKQELPLNACSFPSFAYRNSTITKFSYQSFVPRYFEWENLINLFTKLGLMGKMTTQ